MKFCSKCGKELLDDAKFCDSCGTAAATSENAAEEEVTVAEGNVITEEAPPAKSKTKLFVILGAALVALIVAITAIGNVVSMNRFEEKIQLAYEEMTYGARVAEEYATLQSKVWRNCIYEDDNSETDQYTKNSYGLFYDDFNDALASFYEGEALNMSIVYGNASKVDTLMSELKDCPDKFKEEYNALKELYVAYSGLTDLVIGDSSYSLNTFNEALDSAKANYKSALSSAKLLIG